jgi:hypothetical protein
MRSPTLGYPITVNEGEKNEHERLVRAHTTPHMLTLHAPIMLFAHGHPE